MNASPDDETIARRMTFLRRVSLFADLREQDLKALIDDFRLRKYEKGETLFHQGDTGREVYVVVEGKVRIFTLSLSGEETSINVVSTYDVIGDIAALDHLPRTATAKAITLCRLLEMSGDAFLQRMHEMPDLAFSVARLLTGRVRWMTEYAQTIAQHDAAGRLLHMLLLFNRKFGREIEAGRRYELDLALSQADLASLVGARREWVNRVLQGWRSRGLIDIQAGKIIILDLPQLERERDNRFETFHDKGDW